MYLSALSLARKGDSMVSKTFSRLAGIQALEKSPERNQGLIYPRVNVYIAIENGPLIEDLPIKWI